MKTSACPACGGPVPTDADQCPFCKQYLIKDSPLPAPAAPAPGAPAPAAPAPSAEPSRFGGLDDAPWVVFTIPEDGEVEVDPDPAEIEVVFSQPMKQNSWSFVAVGDEEFPQLLGDPVFRDTMTCVLPVLLEPGRHYAVGVNSHTRRGFVSAAGEKVAAKPHVSRFSTSG